MTTTKRLTRFSQTVTKGSDSHDIYAMKEKNLYKVIKFVLFGDEKENCDRCPRFKVKDTVQCPKCGKLHLPILRIPREMEDIPVENLEMVSHKGFSLSKFLYQIKDKIYEGKEVNAFENVDFKYVQKLIEDIIILVIHLCKSDNYQDCLLAIANFIKHRTNEPLIQLKYLNNVKELSNKWYRQISDFFLQLYPLQSSEFSPIKSMRFLLDKFDQIKHSDAYKHFYKFLMYSLSLNLFEFAGITFDKFKYSQLEAKAIKEKYYCGIDFFHSMLDTLTFLCERGQLCWKMGSIDPLFHSGAKYAEWYEKCTELIISAKYLTNPEAHGITPEKYFGDLDSAIDQGNCILQYAKMMSGYEINHVRELLAKLKQIKSTEFTKDKAMTMRKAPFGLLIFSGSAVGKSTFQDVIFNAHAKILGLPNGDEYRYVYNPFDEYMSGYKSNRWCIISDDSGFRNPNKCTEVDQSVAFLIQAVNNVPILTNQAQLEDKGTIPLRPRLVIATTNVPHLNIKEYFKSALAGRRRLPWCARIAPKPAYARSDSPCMIDPAKLKPDPDKIPDYWIIELYKIVPIDNINDMDINHDITQDAKFEHVETYDDIREFLKWYKDAVLEHERNQDSMMKTTNALKEMKLCLTCMDNANKCKCLTENVQQRTLTQDMLISICLTLAEATEEVNELESIHLEYFRVYGQFHDMTAPEAYNMFFTMARSTSPVIMETHRRIATEFVEQRNGMGPNGDDNFVIETDIRSQNIFHHLYWHIAFFVAAYCGIGYGIGYFISQYIYTSWLSFFVGLWIEYFVSGYCAVGKRLRAYIYNCVMKLWYKKQFIKFMLSTLGDSIAETIGINPKLTRLVIHVTALAGSLYILKQVLPGVWDYVSGNPATNKELKQEVARRYENDIIEGMNDTLNQHTHAKAIVEKLLDHPDMTPALREELTQIHAPQKLKGSTIELKERASKAEEELNALKAEILLQYQTLDIHPNAHSKLLEMCGVNLTDDLQGNTVTTLAPKSYEVGVKPTPSDYERPAVWTNTSLEISDIDVNPCSKSWKNMTREELVVRLSNNCVTFLIHFVRDGEAITRTVAAMAVSSHYFVTNNHVIPDCDFRLDIIWAKVQKGVTRNVFNLHILPENIKTNPEIDLAVIHVTRLPPFRDILDLYPTKNFDGCYNGFILKRGSDGVIVIKDLSALTLNRDYYHIMLKKNLPFWTGYVSEPTKNGDCGSLYIVDSGYGPVVAAMHTSGHGDRVGGVMITKEDVTSLIDSFGFINVQAGVLKLNAPSTNHNLVSLHPKSPLRFMEEGSVEVFGSLDGHRPRNKSLVVATSMQKYLLKHGYEVKYGPPSMTGWQPIRVALDKLFTNRPSWNMRDIKLAARQLLEEHLEVFKNQLHLIEIYDNETVLNGMPGIPYVDPVVTKTSMGHPYNKSKKNFKVDLPSDDIYQHKFTMTDEVMEMVEECWAKVCRGELPMTIFTGSLKDEPRSFAKIQAHKTRLFMACSFDTVFVTRKLLLSFCRLTQMNKMETGIAIGVVAQSTEWTEMYLELIKFGPENIFCGDFVGFDAVTLGEFMFEVIQYFLGIAAAAGYPRWALVAIATVLEDQFYTIIKILNDLIRQNQANTPSGCSITTLINSIVNLVILRMCYNILDPDPTDDGFKKFVAEFVYGDDNIQGSGKKWFNHCSVSKCLAAFSVGYTMADKESESVPFIHISKATFLKRSFRFEPLLGVYVAPLELESIEKSLMVTVRSKSVCLEKQSVDILQSALREYFFHGREMFEEKRALFITLVDDLNLRIYMDRYFPTWDELVANFWSHSDHKYVHYFDSVGERLTIQEQEHGIRNCYICTPESNINPSIAVTVDMSLISSTSDVEEWVMDASSLERPSEVLTLSTGHCDGPNLELHEECQGLDVSQDNTQPFKNFNIFSNCCKATDVDESATFNNLQMQQQSDPHGELLMLSNEQLGHLVRITWVRGQYVKYKNFLLSQLHLVRTSATNIAVLSEEQQRHIVESVIQRLHLSIPIAESNDEELANSLQMDESAQPMDEDTTVIENDETVTFIDTTVGEHNTATSTILPNMLSNVTSKVADMGDFLARPVPIWKTTWATGDTPGVVTTIDPWYLFLNNTKVKYKLNNFAWLSGKLHIKVVINASPFYYGAAKICYQPYGGYVGVPPTTDAGNRHLIQYSQLKHIDIYPQKNSGGEMELSWIYNRDYVNIQSASAVQTLGRLYYLIYSALRSANGVTGTGVSVRMFAWMTEVHLEGPSLGLSLQSDEYSQGVVSRPASVVASIAGKLENAPFLGPFAKATRIGASAISSIASIFGFSNIPNLKETDPFMPTAFPNLAGTSQKYPFHKLTLDPKNELAISASCVGAEQAEDLMVKDYCGKESFLTKFTISTANAADDIVFNTAITPMMFDYNSTTKAFYMTPLCHGSCCNTWWRGGIKIKFTFLASVFHKLRVLIAYDPAGTGTGVLTSDPDPSNSVFSKYVDVTSETEIIVTVPYMQARPFLETFRMDALPTVWQTSGFTFLGNPAFFNGSLIVRVVNVLTAPVATSSIDVLVSVSAAEDFELAGPRIPGGNKKYSFWNLQSEEVSMGPVNPPVEDRNLVFFGERFVSIRQYLQRLCLYRVDPLEAVPFPLGLTYLVRNRMPAHFGYDPNGLDGAQNSSSAMVGFNWCFKTPLTWFAPCYLGYRGSVNWVVNADNPTYISHIRAIRPGDDNTLNYGTTSYTQAYTFNTPSFYLKFGYDGAGGSAITNQHTQAGLSVQYPFYTGYKFLPTSIGTPTSDTQADTSFDRVIFEISSNNVDLAVDGGCKIWQYCGAGTDFSFVQFQFVPVVYNYPNFPNAEPA
uniref:Genome polyprotein n=1 Tax=Darwin bee virus 5 TaxID=2201280 RepID=A0A2U8JQ56_9VIRU|nr:polyprotein [Darwin bee virus 5]